MCSKLSLVLIAAAAVSAGRGGFDASQHQRGPEVIQTSANLALALAQSGYSAGIVLNLPTHLQSVLVREQSRTNAFLSSRSAFGVWLHNDASPGNEHALLRTPAEADAAIAQLTASTGMTISRWRNSRVYLLKRLGQECA
jgi:hypothetical protein